MRKDREFDGIDISEWNGQVRFSKVKESGIRIVYIKATQGTDYVDPEFERNYRDAIREELKVGFYHYVSARDVTEAREEALFFASHIRQKKQHVRAAMDFEEFGNLSVEKIRETALEFLLTLEQEIGYLPAIYSDASNASGVFADRRFERYPLWIADYRVERPDMENPWHRWSGWQYMDNGRVDGITGRVDRDYFRREIMLTASEGNICE